ncbi:aromatic amino acid lyase, partial [Arthrobacter sp. H5]|uniref:aromatic amino acid lyase n=1 Tax=Arthrobacter sp. H5 TaxID=1267973 RepID=UPI0006876E40
MNGALVIDSPGDLGPAVMLAVADGAALELGAALRESLGVHRLRVLAALDNEESVYGVNTGMGAASEIRLDTAAQSVQQDNLMLARAVGSAPWLNRREARVAVAARLRSFLDGDAGVSAELCQGLIDLLNRGLHPAIPRTRNGAAGEIIPLAHLGGCITGSGRFIEGGIAVPATPVLTAAGLAPLHLGPKEGVALIEGIPVTTGLAILQVRAARLLADQSIAALSAGLVLINANRNPFGKAVARANPELAVVVGAVRRLAGDQTLPRSLQAPLSFRVAAPAAAQLLRSAAALGQAVDRALDGVTDSPAFLDGRFTGTAGFDGFDLAAGLDGLRLSVTHLAETSAARLHRLLDERVTGLPRQLSDRPGLH